MKKTRLFDYKGTDNQSTINAYTFIYTTVSSTIYMYFKVTQVNVTN